MQERLTDALPQDSDAQRIGRAAEQSFIANRPTAWKVDALNGGNDCGYDFQIQVVENACVTDVFRAQLKGETSPKLNAAGTHYSVVLDVSTVNYYMLAVEPILLVLCDLSSAQKPKDCNVYYCWIQDEIQRICEKGVASDQKTVTFHVPTENKLSDDLNLSDDVAAFRNLRKLGEGVDVLLKQSGLNTQQRTNAMTRLLPNLERRSATLVGALVDESSTSWVEAPEGSLQWHLQETDIALNSGNRQRCQELLAHAEALAAPAKPSEQADCWHLKGRLAVFDQDDIAANVAFDKAHRLNPANERHVILWAETELRLWLHTATQPADFSRVTERLTSQSASALAMRARLIAAEGNFQEALAIADNIVGIEGNTTKVIILSMQAKWADAIDACNEALTKTDLRKLYPRLLLLIQRARARFSLAVGIDQISDEEVTLPANGPSDVNMALLISAWEDISEVAGLLRSHGWPPHVEGIADIWANTAIILGLQEVVLPVMKEAGETRPRMDLLQEGVELLAVRTGDFELALKANERQSETERVIQRRISLLHMAGKHPECITLMQTKGEQSSSNPHTYAHALSLAIFSAEKMVQMGLAERWTNLLNCVPEAAPVAALHRYFHSVSENTLGKDAALAELEAEYELLRRPAFIAKSLFHELDATQPDQAAKILRFAEELQREQLLNADESLRLAQSFTTLRKWTELLALSDHATERFKQHDRLAAVGALALDKLGRTVEARDRLQNLIAKESPDSLALNTYLNIAIVSGMTSEAIACLESVLSNETDPRGKLRCLRHMFGLIQASEPTSPRLADIAWRIGKLANQESEFEEGLFLISMMALVTHTAVELTDNQKAELTRRIDAFVEHFPNSRTLMRRSLPDDISGKNLLKMLEEFTGVGEKQLREREKLRNLVSRGATVAPFAWRPSFIVAHAHDIATLWEMSKTSNRDHHEFHLTMVLGGWEPAPYSRMQNRIPLLDLTALLVIHDLDLFDTLFEIFPKIAVGKATLLQLQNLKSPLSLSPQRDKCNSILSALQYRLDKIEQPSSYQPEDDGFLKEKWASQEIVEIVKVDTRFFVYSDDVIFRIYATEGDSKTLSICTLDMLAAAESRHIMSPQTIGTHMAQLCDWRVGIAVGTRHLIAVLPDELAGAKSITQAIDILSRGLPHALFTGIWDWRKPFSELHTHLFLLLRELVEELKNSIISVAAIVGLWASKARLHSDAPGPYSELIGLAVCQASMIDRPLTKSAANRLWAVYNLLIETHYGDRMDDGRYAEAIRTLASIAAHVDVTFSLLDDRSVVDRLKNGLTAGTSDYDKFIDGVKASLVELAQR